MHLVMTIVYTWEGRAVNDSSKVNWRAQPSARCSLFIIARGKECNSVFDIEIHGKKPQNMSLVSIIPYVFVFEIRSHCVRLHAQHCIFVEGTVIAFLMNVIQNFFVGKCVLCGCKDGREKNSDFVIFLK